MIRPAETGTPARKLMSSNNAGMRAICDQVELVAATDATVLLSGETGTGKGFTARLIHTQSDRRDGPFIGIHCGAIPESLMESELFGHEQGAFTGALKKYVGKLENAHHGTILLDEISTMSPAGQAKLLRFVQHKMLRRVGGTECIRVDCRVIAASNHDLKALCAANRFRWDLYFRLNVFPIDLPRLRDRVEDIPLLAQLCLDRLNDRFGRGISGIDSSFIEALVKYEWPGNIRELENLMERAYIQAQGTSLSITHLPPELLTSKTSNTLIPLRDVDIRKSLASTRKRAVAHIEEIYLANLLLQHYGSIDVTANAAGMTVRQLNNLMNKYNMRKEAFKRPRPARLN